MLKNILVILLFTFIACQDKGVEPFLYERDTPSWLKDKIDYMSAHKDFVGTTVYRYEWKGDYVFDITIPISSCGLCEVYDESGNKIDWVKSSVQDYLENRKTSVLIWKYSFN